MRISDWSSDVCSSDLSCGVRTSCWPSDVWRRGFIFPCGAPRATVGNGVHLQAEGVPQVDATHVRIGQQRVRSPLREHAAFAEDLRPVANAQGLADVVVGDQNADAAALEVAADADRKGPRMNSRQ